MRAALTLLAAPVAQPAEAAVSPAKGAVSKRALMRSAGTAAIADQFVNGTIRLNTAMALKKRPLPADLATIPALDAAYLTAASRARTVIVCGSSSSKPGTEPFEPAAAELTRAIVEAGGNVVTGCGSHGIMGAAYYGAAEGAKAFGAGENLTVVKEPAWGDEDFVNGRALAKMATEETRFDLFQKLGATLVLFPGGVGTFLEAAKAIEGAQVARPGLPAFEKIVFVGGDTFYAGLKAQLDAMLAGGTMKPEIRAKFIFSDSSTDLPKLVMPSCLTNSTKH